MLMKKLYCFFKCMTVLTVFPYSATRWRSFDHKQIKKDFLVISDNISRMLIMIQVD